MRYGVQGSAVVVRSVEMVSGDSSGGMYVISGLSASTTYSIEVAAVTGEDRIGVYRSPIFKETDGKLCGCSVYRDS